MKNYLVSFTEKNGYGKERIDALSSALDSVLSSDAARESFEKAIGLYGDDMNVDFGVLQGLCQKAAEASGVDERAVCAVLLICLSEKLEERYKEAKLPIELMHESLLDILYKLDECVAVYGVEGTFVFGWFKGFYDLTRFTFGRLQFEGIPFGREYEKNGVKLLPSDTVLNVHIPRTGVPLTPGLCDDAFGRAAEFFKDKTKGKTAFVCHSWLLFPEHEKMLKRGNVKLFMERFDILESGYSDDGSDLWRLFDTMEKDPDKLPYDSGLRRAYVDWLRAGNKTGWGYGVYLYGTDK